MAPTAYKRRRLTRRELWLINYIGRQQASGPRFAALSASERALAIPLWREGLIEIWYRQMPIDDPLPSRPHFGLSSRGRKLFQSPQAHTNSSRVTASTTTNEEKQSEDKRLFP